MVFAFCFPARFVSLPSNPYNMQKIVALLLLITVVAVSCARSVTPHQAANKHYKNCRNVR